MARRVDVSGGADPAKAKVRVLIVDDDPMMARTMVDILRFRGFQVEKAHSAGEAIDLVAAAASSFDWLISDIRMPDLNGVELLQILKASHSALKAILMTAYATDELVDRGLREGVAAVLTKPVDLDRVFGLLDRPSLSNEG